MLNTPFSSWPSFTQEEADAVSRVVLSNKVNYWTGVECREFEKEFAAFSETKHAISLANGTVALDLAFQGLGIGPGDEVIVTSRTFVASVSSIVNSGAKPIFADVDPDSQNITAETIGAVLTPQTKAILCVHLAGWPCEMDDIHELAVQHELFVIEDCAQAHGARYKGRSVGSIGHVAAWSFCQDKIMSTGGEGGMVTTNDTELWSRMWSIKDHGKSWDAIYNRVHPPGFRWLHERFGTNWRMTEMQAAVGRIQLKRMTAWHKTRVEYANQIWKTAAALPGLRVPSFHCERCEGACDQGKRCEHAAYKCYVFVDGTEQDRDSIMAKINESGVPCFSGSCSEVYLEKAFDRTGWRPAERLPVAKRLGESSLMFLCHPTLTQAEINKTCSVLSQVVSDYNAAKEM
ncbi:DegT/DnrJ/EryC1/StrS aminotransferase family protein [Marinobacterium sp. xm-d-530]|uniref:DegT/DnrJ/EryC1/StrS family aminotransferase n=1 Tax=Marinobacterium sp. xm-d-530 TaxID=2497747 RepID=UPI00156891E6|nr:DegT/DnrJ/EryC1/StrS aminotransferase family protein [Marinobacterium sp. xm-d-530]NRQ01162.1 dTDP-3-amino-3,6-dideoxy-alpha-D-galactopyranose transaminase [Marinobacterium sp. xm-d-530]